MDAQYSLDNMMGARALKKGKALIAPGFLQESLQTIPENMCDVDFHIAWTLRIVQTCFEIIALR